MDETAQDVSQDESDDELGGCRPPVWLILVALGVIVGAAFLGVQVLSVVWGLVFPPDAPRPDNLTELSHESIDTRVDEWRYEVNLSPCDLVAFYEDEGSTCSLNAETCASGRYSPPVFAVPSVAECVGVREFATFALRWRVSVDPIYRGADANVSTFTLLSEVLWGGAPLPTSTPPSNNAE